MSGSLGITINDVKDVYTLTNECNCCQQSEITDEDRVFEVLFHMGSMDRSIILCETHLKELTNKASQIISIAK